MTPPDVRRAGGGSGKITREAVLAPALAVYDGAAELERGLDILLIGLTATLPPPSATRPPQRMTHQEGEPPMSTRQQARARVQARDPQLESSHGRT
jgi:hypothetical protein